MGKEGINETEKINEIENSEKKEDWKVISKNFYDYNLKIGGIKGETAFDKKKKFLENLELAAKAHGLIIRNIVSSKNSDNVWDDDGGYNVKYEVIEPSKLLSKEDILKSD